MTEYSGELVVGGGFSRAGTALVNNIAAWNGRRWSRLGDGINYRVEALTVYQGRLIAGGGFSQAGGIVARNIARWDGAQWEPLAEGLSGRVRCLTVYDNELIAGGDFDSAGGVVASGIAAWDGSQWHTLGSGLKYFESRGRALTVVEYNGQLIAGGYFTSAGDVEAENVARWDGTAWSPLGEGAGSIVLDLVEYQGKLIGSSYPGFYRLNDMNIFVAFWDRVEWLPFGDTLNGPVNDFVEFGGDLYAAGQYYTTPERLYSGIARWDGAHWEPFWADANGYVLALAEYDGQMAAAGRFNIHAGHSAAHFGMYDPVCADMSATFANDDERESGLLATIHNYPNPFNPSTMIGYSLTSDAAVTLEIFNMVGQRVRILVDHVDQAAGSYEVPWDGRNRSGKSVASGVYLFRLRAGDFVTHNKMIMLK